MRARLLAVLVPVALACLAACDGCGSHEPYCGASAQCVEDCGEISFLSCGPCPDGAIPAEDCADAAP